MGKYLRSSARKNHHFASNIKPIPPFTARLIAATSGVMSEWRLFLVLGGIHGVDPRRDRAPLEAHPAVPGADTTALEWEASLTFGPPLSPSGLPKSEVAAPPAKMLEATSTVASPAPRNQPRVPTFSAVEIAGLLARGDWLFATGNVASARLLYERAAGAGEARAAVRLGETFDPVYLNGSHLRGLHGDPEMAVFWYRHARDLGATGVASRLKKLEAKEGRN
jgi:hypothetical protein